MYVSIFHMLPEALKGAEEKSRSKREVVWLIIAGAVLTASLGFI